MRPPSEKTMHWHSGVPSAAFGSIAAAYSARTAFRLPRSSSET